MGLRDIFSKPKQTNDLPEHIINHHQTAEKLNIFGKDMTDIRNMLNFLCSLKTL